MTRRHQRKSPFEGSENVTLKKSPFSPQDLLAAIDESPEFHDPYSELNLFLSKQIKKEMNHCSNSKKWSVQLQEELLHKIAPEFQKRFPHYRLGTTALKKTWEKVHYYAAQIADQKEAFTQEGKLNVPFFIKENLKSAGKIQNTCHVHPCHFAHQLAVKMSECLAVVDGIRPKIDELTRTIWSLQRHLIPKLSTEHYKSPYDENDKGDKLIVKAILLITAKSPEISQPELAYHVEKDLRGLFEVTKTYSHGTLGKMLTALFADRCHLASQRMEKTLERIPYPVAKILEQELAQYWIDQPDLTADKIVEETSLFFEKAQKALRDLSEEELERKIQNWTQQSDMLLRWIRLSSSSALFKEMEAAWKQSNDLSQVLSSGCQTYLDKYPRLLTFAKEVKTWGLIYLKWLFYTKGFEEKVSTYERFIHWHKAMLCKEKLPPQQLIEKVERRSKKMLPLIPFNRARTQTILVTEHQVDTNKDHR